MKNLIKKIIPSFFLDWYYLSLPFLGTIFYGFPSKRFKVGDKEWPNTLKMTMSGRFEIQKFLLKH